MNDFDTRRLLCPNVIFGITLAILSIAFIYAFIPAFINEPPGLKNPMLSPRWLPMVMGWGCFILSMSLVIAEFFHPEIAEHHVHEKSLHVLVLCAVLLSYVLLFETAGAILIGVVATVALFAIRSVKSIVAYILAIALPFVVYFFFTTLLEVPLPTGIFME
ncbi:MAG: tripartite tricarboxylate transporter TctB family protein [Methylocystaceae bacterium]|nr:tripartite tricarboxylate transporter TctB family protein [Methylocystaceae bacterium]